MVFFGGGGVKQNVEFLCFDIPGVDEGFTRDYVSHLGMGYVSLRCPRHRSRYRISHVIRFLGDFTASKSLSNYTFNKISFFCVLRSTPFRRLKCIQCGDNEIIILMVLFEGVSYHRIVDFI